VFSFCFWRKKKFLDFDKKDKRRKIKIMMMMQEEEKSEEELRTSTAQNKKKVKPIVLERRVGKMKAIVEYNLWREREGGG